MFLVAGLGNPGDRYEKTRHNVGFQFVDFLHKLLEKKDAASPWISSKKLSAEIATGQIGKRKIILLKPVTFMNESGRAVAAAAAFYKIPPEQCIVIYDDIALPLGSIRLRKNGSSGGQKGMGSIIRAFGSDSVPRLRIGIASTRPIKTDAKIFVLKPFAKKESEMLKELFQASADAVETAITTGFDRAMSIFNAQK